MRDCISHVFDIGMLLMIHKWLKWKSSLLCVGLFARVGLLCFQCMSFFNSIFKIVRGIDKFCS